MNTRKTAALLMAATLGASVSGCAFHYTSVDTLEGRPVAYSVASSLGPQEFVECIRPGLEGLINFATMAGDLYVVERERKIDVFPSSRVNSVVYYLIEVRQAESGSIADYHDGGVTWISETRPILEACR